MIMVILQHACPVADWIAKFVQNPYCIDHLLYYAASLIKQTVIVDLLYILVDLLVDLSLSRGGGGSLEPPGGRTCLCFFYVCKAL